MILSPQVIYKQIKKLTADLIGSSLCDQQNFPCINELGQGVCEVGVGSKGSLSRVLKDVAYRETYAELEKTNTYNMRMLDGALIHLMYRFRQDKIEAHRLAFFPSPSLEEFQNNPDIYLDDEIYGDIVKKNVVPFPLRFDFDNRAAVVAELDHPASHLTLGQYQNCRIPVSAPLTPSQFIDFILRHFYNTAYRKYAAELTSFKDAFEPTITPREKALLYMHVSESREAPSELQKPGPNPSKKSQKKSK